MTLEATVGRVRIDKQHRDAYQAQHEVAKAVRTATENAGLERTLVELVNIRVSQINGCAILPARPCSRRAARWGDHPAARATCRMNTGRTASKAGP